MEAIKSEIEDLSFKILNPIQYNKILKRLELSTTERESILSKIINEINEIIKNKDIKKLGYLVVINPFI